MVLPKLKSALSLILFFLVCDQLRAQTCLDDYCYFTTSYSGDISKNLNEGFRAFFIDSSISEKELSVANQFLEENPDEKLVMIGAGPLPGLLAKLSKAGLKSQLYNSQRVDSLLGVVINPSDRFFVFSQSNPDFLETGDHIIQYNGTISHPMGSSSGLEHFTHFTLSDTIPVEAGKVLTAEFVQRTGRLPNFLETGNPVAYKAFLDSLNRIKRFKAIVLKDGQPMEGISWKELPQMETYGKVHVTERIISPGKKGYRFSPDVSTFTPVNENVIKVFHGYFQDINEGLMMQLDFDNNIVNQVRPEDKYLYGFVAYDEDDERGTYSIFDGNSNYIDFGIPSGMDFQEITVAAWIKPEALDGNKSIVGIGEVFSAKITESRLTFTTPAIKDHRTDSAMVEVGKWQHVAFVFQANKEMQFFYNGKNVGIQPASDITITSHSLLVGSNLWSEYFKGGIDDLYIWSRVLSGEEVAKIYQQGLQKNEGSNFVRMLLIACLALVGFTVAYFFWKKRKRGGIAESAPVQRPAPLASSDRNAPGIYLFGGFRLINKEGKNLSNLFSPKRKELFVLVLLYTFRKNGIDSKRMSEILWEGHSFESAKNNRSTQMKRVREILEENSGVSIDYDNKNWKIKIEEGVSWDFSDYTYFRNQLQKSKETQHVATNVNGLLGVINQGVLLPNMHYEWLDPIKGQLSEEIIETLTPLLEDSGLGLDTELKLRISNSIFSLDPLNERALKIKIKLLVSEGNHTLAKNAFDQFCHAYTQFYGEEYQISFSSLV